MPKNQKGRHLQEMSKPAHTATLSHIVDTKETKKDWPREMHTTKDEKKKCKNRECDETNKERVKQHTQRDFHT